MAGGWPGKGWLDTGRRGTPMAAPYGLTLNAR